MTCYGYAWLSIVFPPPLSPQRCGRARRARPSAVPAVPAPWGPASTWRCVARRSSRFIRTARAAPLIAGDLDVGMIMNIYIWIYKNNKNDKNDNNNNTNNNNNNNNNNSNNNNNLFMVWENYSIYGMIISIFSSHGAVASQVCEPGGTEGFIEAPGLRLNPMGKWWGRWWGKDGTWL